MRVVFKPMGIALLLLTIAAAVIIPAVRMQSMRKALDDAQSAHAAVPTPEPTPNPSFVPVGVKNPKMTDMEGSLPSGWSLSWTGKGKALPSRDTRVFYSAPAALGIEAVDGEGQIGQVIEAKEGSAWTVKGYVRSEGEVTAFFGVQAYRAWTPIATLKIAAFQGAMNWTPFQDTVILPKGTTRAAIVLYVNGKGKAWLDDVSASRAPDAIANVPVSGGPKP